MVGPTKKPQVEGEKLANCGDGGTIWGSFQCSFQVRLLGCIKDGEIYPLMLCASQLTNQCSSTGALGQTTLSLLKKEESLQSLHLNS